MVTLVGLHVTSPPTLAQPAATPDMQEALRRNREAYAAYYACVEQKRPEFDLYQRAFDVRQLRDIKANLRARDSHDPEILTMEAQVDQGLALAWTRYQAAGGTAASPESVVVPSPPCPSPIPIPAGREGNPAPLLLRKSIQVPAPPPAEPIR